VLTTDAQRQAYASGVTVWREIENSVVSQRALGISLDTAQVLAGLQDAATHRPLRLSPEETERVMTDLNGDYLRRMNEARLRQVEAGKAYRVSFSKQKGAYSDAGTWYRIEDKGTGRHLKPGDMVLLEVTGTLPDGTVFDASGQHGQTRRVKVGALLPPVSIGLQRVGVGGHLTVVVPPAKGYGDAGLPPSVPGGATLIFDIRVKALAAG
jgi:FKBP-type peptidyl-prolyl cis-trans isomerase